VLASAPDALIAVDSQGRIVFVNDQAERLFGWTSDDLVSTPIATVMPAAELDQRTAHHVLNARRKDGSSFLAELSLSTVADDAGSPLVLLAVRDRAALDGFRDASAPVSGLPQAAAKVAHDFNNLLGVILNYSILVGRRVNDPTAVADLAEIRTAAERGVELVRQLQAASLPEEESATSFGGPAVVNGGTERILLVEDEAPLRLATARMLAEHGYDVVVATDGVHALDLYDRPGAPIDLVVTDVAMPRMRGDELALLLHDRDARLPVLFLSGYESAELVMTGRVLAKAAEEPSLLLAIREALDARSA
jgi:PAS domain S-box-containing protein